MTLELRCPRHPHYQGLNKPRRGHDGQFCKDCLMLYSMENGPTFLGMDEYKPIKEETTSAVCEEEIELAEPIPNDDPTGLLKWGLKYIQSFKGDEHKVMSEEEPHEEGRTGDR